MLVDLWPQYGLIVTTPRLELRLPRERLRLTREKWLQHTRPAVSVKGLTASLTMFGLSR